MNRNHFQKRFEITPPKTSPVLVVGNHKGGVGKTTISTCFAAIAAYMGLRVLLAEVDSQRSATMMLIEDPSHFGKGYLDILDLMIRNDLEAENVIVNSKIDGLYLLPGGERMESRFNSIASRTFAIPSLALKKRISPLREKVDLIIIDTPPELSSMVDNAYGCATHYLYPHDGSAFSECGILDTEKQLNQTIREINPEIKCVGILGNLMHTQSLTHQIANETKTIGNVPYIPHIIPRREMVKNRTYDNQDDQFWVRDIFNTNANVRDIEETVYEAAFNVFEKIGILKKVDSNE